MTLCSRRFLVHVPLLWIGAAVLAAYVALFHPPSSAWVWLLIVVGGPGGVWICWSQSCLVLLKAASIRVVRPSGVRVLPRAQARLLFRVHHGQRGWSYISILLQQAPPLDPVVIDEVSSIGYPRTARRARQRAEALSRKLQLPWSEEGLESRQFEAERAAHDRKTVRFVALWSGIMALVSLAGSLLGWWIFSH